MKKIIAGILLAQLFFCLYSTAQSTDVLRNELNTIFQNIDKSQIPTGYLEEYGPGFAPLSVFNGVLTDSNLCDSAMSDFQGVFSNGNFLFTTWKDVYSINFSNSQTNWKSKLSSGDGIPFINLIDNKVTRWRN